MSRVKREPVHHPARLAILIGPKSSGSNMAAIAEACRTGHVDAEVVRVIAPNSTSPGLARAQAMGLPTGVADPVDLTYSEVLLKWAFEDGWDLICLAGFLRLLPTAVLDAFPDRILNVHPSLLPKYGGKGMFGRHVHEAVIANAEPESGCSVHLVNARYDEGRILIQKRCKVEPNDTPESLAARIAPMEHQAYLEALRMLIAS